MRRVKISRRLIICFFLVVLSVAPAGCVTTAGPSVPPSPSAPPSIVETAKIVRAPVITLDTGVVSLSEAKFQVKGAGFEPGKRVIIGLTVGEKTVWLGGTIVNANGAFKVKLPMATWTAQIQSAQTDFGVNIEPGMYTLVAEGSGDRLAVALLELTK